jgi:hypothetical protein
MMWILVKNGLYKLEMLMVVRGESWGLLTGSREHL